MEILSSVRKGVAPPLAQTHVWKDIERDPGLRGIGDNVQAFARKGVPIWEPALGK